MGKLGNYIEITNGFAFKSSKYSDKGGRVIRITNVQKGKIKDENPKFYPENLLEDLKKYKIYEEDILMSLTGNVGRVGKFPKRLLPAYINQRVCRVMSKSDKLNNNYLYHILNSDDFEKRARDNSTGIAQLNLSTKWLEELSIPLPPLKTQQQIAKILDDASHLRNKTQQLINEYDLLAQVIFLETFGDPVINPKGWGVENLKVLTNKIGSGATPRGGKGTYHSEGISLVRSLNIYDNSFKYKDLAFIDESQAKKLKNATLQENDVLINITGASVARCSVVPLDVLPARVNQHVSILRCKFSVLNSTFLHHLIISPNCKVKLLGVGSSNAATRESITKEQLEKFEIIVPPIALQNEFAEKIALIEAQKTLAKQELQEAENLFHCLLQKAFKGKLVV